MAQPKHYRLNAEPANFGLVTTRQVPLDCGRCHGRAFHIIVAPEGETARPTAVECTNCGNGWKIGSHGCLETTGKVTVHNGGAHGRVQ